MRQHLQDILFEKYPKIFIQKDLPMTRTCMCWGIQCGDGWFYLLDELCNRIQQHVDNKKIQQVEAAQVKSKWGGLIFYVDNSNEYVDGLISMAERISYRVRERNGYGLSVDIDDKDRIIDVGIKSNVKNISTDSQSTSQGCENEEIDLYVTYGGD